MSNLFLGCCALLFVFHGQIDWASWCTAGSFICDYLDGMTARALKIQSPLGKELDSLADVVSFGVVPGSLFFLMINQTYGITQGNSILGQPLAYLGFVLAAFSALRLAKFNLDTRQTDYFLGLSTPACTLFVLGLALTAAHDVFGLRTTILNPYLLVSLVILLSWLLVSEIPMFGMKIKNLNLLKNKPVLLAILSAPIIIYIFRQFSLSVFVVLYVFASLIFRKKIIV